MTTPSRRNFSKSIDLGVHASELREKNLKAIMDVIATVKNDIESYTKNKVSIDLRDSQKHTFLKAAALLSSFDNTHPILQKLTNQVIFALSTQVESKTEDLTVLEFGSEGFPCTINVDGNRFTSADIVSFEDSIESLLSSPTTGEKIKKLMNIEIDENPTVISHEVLEQMESCEAKSIKND